MEIWGRLTGDRVSVIAEMFGRSDRTDGVLGLCDVMMDMFLISTFVKDPSERKLVILRLGIDGYVKEHRWCGTTRWSKMFGRTLTVMWRI